MKEKKLTDLSPGMEDFLISENFESAFTDLVYCETEPISRNDFEIEKINQILADVERCEKFLKEF